MTDNVKNKNRKEIIFMLGIEIAFFALGFVTCLFLLTVITEVNDRDKKNKKELKKAYRNALKEQEEEQNYILSETREDIEIDVKVW